MEYSTPIPVLFTPKFDGKNLDLLTVFTKIS